MSCIQVNNPIIKKFAVPKLYSGYFICHAALAIYQLAFKKPLKPNPTNAIKSKATTKIL